MRRWILAGLGVMFVGAAFLFLLQPVNAYDYSGSWYSAKDGQRYLFEEGLIFGQTGEMDGGYCPANKKLLIFVTDMDGLEIEQELYFIRQQGRDTLCDRETDSIYFYRES